MTKEELLPKELLEQIPPLYSNEETPTGKTIIRVKYFLASFTWLVTECEQDDNDVLFYGFVINDADPACSEWGHFTLNQLMEIKLVDALGVEWDLYFTKCAYVEYMRGNGK
jgi:hypothetical protein